MALPPFATPADVVAVFRPLTSAEEVLATGLLEQVSNKLRRVARRRSADLDTLMLDELNADAVKAAVVNAVKRVLQNPEAIRQLSTTDGPFTESRTVDTAISSGFLYLDPADLEDIFPSVKKQRLMSFSVKSGFRS